MESDQYWYVVFPINIQKHFKKRKKWEEETLLLAQVIQSGTSILEWFVIVKEGILDVI